MLATFALHNAENGFGTDRLNGGARVIQRSRFNFFPEAQRAQTR
jgi:hypothetical protein